MNGGVHIAQEDLALYAMGDLRGEDLARMRTHLQSCAECTEELTRIAGDLAALAASVEQHPIPEGARRRLVSSIQSTVATDSVSSTATVTPISSGRSGTAWVPWAIAAALAVGAAGLGVKVNSLRDQLQKQSRMLAQSQVESVRSQRVLSLLKAPQAQRATLTAAKTPAEPTGHAIYLAERGELIFQGNNLKSLPEDKAYELWVIPENGAAAIPAGVFKPDRSGDATVVMPPLPLGVPAKAFAVTVERAEGVSKAEGPIVLSGAPMPGE
jgi:anti-sigma-K factor RskA